MVRKENQPSNKNRSINNSLYFNNNVFLEKEEIIKFIDDVQLNNPLYLESLKSLKKLENGGFDHDDMSNLYVTFQNDKRYKTTRYKGWKNLFRLMLYAKEKSLNKSSENLSIIDFLSGSGTLSKRLKTLWKQEQNTPTVLGIDISEKMCQLAHENGETVFWGSYKNHCFKEHIVDTVIAGYGVHHVPLQERMIFIKSAYNILKENGVCLIHDFLEGHPSARWYSEIIHKYRTYGHNCKHFTEEDMLSLFSKDFLSSEVQFIYDPFYLVGQKGQDENSLKQEFFSYLISLFNLSKLLPKAITFEQIFHYKDESYWKEVEEIFTPYFRLSQYDIKRINYFEKKNQKL